MSWVVCEDSIGWFVKTQKYQDTQEQPGCVSQRHNESQRHVIEMNGTGWKQTAAVCNRVRCAVAMHALIPDENCGHARDADLLLVDGKREGDKACMHAY